jgi:adenine deaminase
MSIKNIIESRKDLVDVAMGRKPASMVIRDAHWVCVQSGEVIAGTDVAIYLNRIAYVGVDASHTIGDSTKIIHADGRYLTPGLLDAHMHIESGMLTITEFVRAVIPHGTTGMFVDPHEIANVFGLKGVRLMVDEAKAQPIHVWVQVPSCVPSAPGLETPGASITPADVAEALSWDGIIGLGEVMNFPGVYMNDEKMHAEMAETRDAGKVIGGHYASPDLGIPFHGYVAGGPEDDHEGTRLEDAIARVRQGMKAILRYGSGWKDVDAQITALTEMGLDPRHFLLCTDDSHSETLVSEDHINRAVKRAISQGVKPITAIQMATINTAEHFGVARDVGMIAPGRFADMLLVEDLPSLSISQVIVKGQILAENGLLTIDLPSYDYPAWVKESIHVKKEIVPKDFRISVPAEKVKVVANVIGVIENQAPTRHLKLEMPVTDGELTVDFERDIAKIALVERHHNTGRIQVGLVQGFGLLRKCAIASTVAHDCHHMIVVGTDENDMAIAANKLVRVGGGQVVVCEGEIIGLVELPIAGIMSNIGAKKIARQAGSVLDGFKACGSTIENPNMQLSLLALVVIPELRISDLGLVDASGFNFINLIDE